MVHISLKHNSSNTKKAQCLNYLQFIGLKIAGVPAVNKSLLFGGRNSFQFGGTPFTGQVDLFVGQGSLRNTEVPAKLKKLFKKEIIPVMAEAFPEIDKCYTGKIELHLSEGLLSACNLTH